MCLLRFLPLTLSDDNFSCSLCLVMSRQSCDFLFNYANINEKIWGFSCSLLKPAISSLLLYQNHSLLPDSPFSSAFGLLISSVGHVSCTCSWNTRLISGKFGCFSLIPLNDYRDWRPCADCSIISVNLGHTKLFSDDNIRVIIPIRCDCTEPYFPAAENSHLNRRWRCIGLS